MKKILFLLFVLILNIRAQSDFSFDFDYAQFRYDSTSNYLELYYSFNKEDLTIVADNGNSFVNALMHIQIQNLETDELVVNKSWSFDQPVESGIDDSPQTILGSVGFVLKSGSFKLNISVEDINNSSIRKEFTESFGIRPFSEKRFHISDIELATRIINESANENSIFYKNTLEVYPNPSILYTQYLPVLFYYSEFYGLNNDISSNNLELTKKIFSSQNDVIYESSNNISRRKESKVEIGVINLKKYPTDTYTLVLTLTDKESKKATASTKKFFLVNPDVVALSSNNSSASTYLSSEFGVYANEECDELFSKSKIIASAEEIDRYEKLDSLNHKREYLYKFWRKRDDSPVTDANEFKNAYLKRIEIANARFRTMSNPGYKTDRGRIYLKYGEPDEIDRYPNETNSKPYEIWTYHQIEGGVIFAFGDLTGFNYYELLHSTKRGELQDPNWTRRISTN